MLKHPAVGRLTPTFNYTPGKAAEEVSFAGAMGLQGLKALLILKAFGTSKLVALQRLLF